MIIRTTRDENETLEIIFDNDTFFSAGRKENTIKLTKEEQSLLLEILKENL